MIITGGTTVYFTLLHASGNNFAQVDQVKVGPMEGPLPKSLFNLDNPYTRQSSIYRLNDAGEPVTLWSEGIGFHKAEYDPDYLVFLRLREKFEEENK